MIVNGLSQIRTAVENQAELQKLQKATQQFEAMFLKDLLKSMRKGVKETQFASVPGKEMFRDMLDETVATKASESGGVGIADYLFEAMKNQVIRSTVNTNSQKNMVNP